MCGKEEQIIKMNPAIESRQVIQIHCYRYIEYVSIPCVPLYFTTFSLSNQLNGVLNIINHWFLSITKHAVSINHVIGLSYFDARFLSMTICYQ